MAEISPTIDNLTPSIPNNWQFPEKSDSNLNVLFVDENNRYLRVSRRNGKPNDIVESDELERVFDEKGLPLVSRKAHHGFSRRSGHSLSLSIEKQGETNMQAIFTEESGLKIGKRKDTVEIVGLKKMGKKDVTVLFDYPNPSSICFSEGGVLKILVLGNKFKLPDNTFIESPHIWIFNKAIIKNPDKNIEATAQNPSIKFDIEEMQRPGIRKEKTSAVFFNDKGEEEFLLEWNLETRKVDEGKEVTYIVFSQTHVPSKSKRVLESPIQINMKRVTSAAFSSGEKWRDIDTLIQARLSYSYPQSH